MSDAADRKLKRQRRLKRKSKTKAKERRNQQDLKFSLQQRDVGPPKNHLQGHIVSQKTHPKFHPKKPKLKPRHIKKVSEKLKKSQKQREVNGKPTRIRHEKPKESVPKNTENMAKKNLKNKCKRWNRNQNGLLQRAIKEKSRGLLRAYIKRQKELNEDIEYSRMHNYNKDMFRPTSWRGLPPLHRAVKTNSIHFVKEFLSTGIDLFMKDQYGLTALHHCDLARSEGMEIFAFLWETNIDKCGEILTVVTPIPPEVCAIITMYCRHNSMRYLLKKMRNFLDQKVLVMPPKPVIPYVKRSGRPSWGNQRSGRPSPVVQII